MDLNKYIDHTLLSAAASYEEIKILCEEAIQHKFYAVCVNGSRIKDAKRILGDSGVKLAATIGFPLGAFSKESKISEAEQAVKDGADEIDMVMNIGWFKDGNFDKVRSEIQEIKSVIGDVLLKVIVETCYLSDDEIISASKIVGEAGADFIKTSTGFGSRGASLDDIKLMKEGGQDSLKIKASGGIRDAKTALEYIDLGVDRIGTSSGIKIVT